MSNPVPGLFATPTRKQVKNSRAFDGGEGIWFHEGTVYLTSKGDNRVWSYSTNELFGKEDITTVEEQELSDLVDLMILELDQEIAQIDI